MGIQPARVFDIAYRQEVQLSEPAAAGRVYRKENGPKNEAASDANVPQDLEEPQEEECIERAIVKDHCVRNLEKGHDPVEPARGEGLAW